MTVESRVELEKQELFFIFDQAIEQWKLDNDIKKMTDEQYKSAIQSLISLAVSMAARAEKFDFSVSGEVLGGSRDIMETFKFYFECHRIDIKKRD